MRFKRWQVVLLVASILWLVFLEFFGIFTHGPTITWVFVHFVPEATTMTLVSACIGFVGGHFTNEYRKAKRDNAGEKNITS